MIMQRPLDKPGALLAHPRDALSRVARIECPPRGRSRVGWNLPRQWSTRKSLGPYIDSMVADLKVRRVVSLLSGARSGSDALPS